MILSFYFVIRVNLAKAGAETLIGNVQYVAQMHVRLERSSEWAHTGEKKAFILCLHIVRFQIVEP